MVFSALFVVGTAPTERDVGIWNVAISFRGVEVGHPGLRHCEQAAYKARADVSNDRLNYGVRGYGPALRLAACLRETRLGVVKGLGNSSC